MERVRFQSKYCFWIEVWTCSLTLWLSQSPYVLVSLNLSLSLVLSSSLSNPPPAVFYQILSQGASYKTNRAHQDRAPEDRFGQPSLIYCGPGWVKASAGIYQASDFECWFKLSARKPLHWEWFAMKTMVKGTWAVVLNQQSCPETLDKHTAPGFVSGLVGLWGRKVCA